MKKFFFLLAALCLIVACNKEVKQVSELAAIPAPPSYQYSNPDYGVYDLRDFGDIENDFAGAWYQAMAIIPSNSKIKIPMGFYKVDTMLSVHTYVTIEGSGGGGLRGAGTTLEFCRECHGIRVFSQYDRGPENVGPGRNGRKYYDSRGTIIKNIRLTQRGPTNPSLKGSGIVATGYVHLENVIVEGFNQNGLDIRGNVATDKGNSSHSVAYSCEFEHCNIGIYKAGDDSNYFRAFGCRVINNLKSGIEDASLLSSWYFGTNVHNNGQLTRCSYQHDPTQEKGHWFYHTNNTSPPIGIPPAKADGTVNPGWIRYQRAGGRRSATKLFPAWDSTFQYPRGGAIIVRDGQKGWFGLYLEGGQGTAQLGYLSPAIGVTAGSGTYVTGARLDARDNGFNFRSPITVEAPQERITIGGSDGPLVIREKTKGNQLKIAPTPDQDFGIYFNRDRRPNITLGQKETQFPYEPALESYPNIMTRNGPPIPGIGLEAPIKTLLYSRKDFGLYLKIGPRNTDWARIETKRLTTPPIKK